MAHPHRDVTAADDPAPDDDSDVTAPDQLPGGDLLGDDEEFEAEGLQTSTGGGMGPESYPSEDEEDYSGNGADRGPS